PPVRAGARREAGAAAERFARRAPGRLRPGLQWTGTRDGLGPRAEASGARKPRRRPGEARAAEATAVRCHARTAVLLQSLGAAQARQLPTLGESEPARDRE